MIAPPFTALAARRPARCAARRVALAAQNVHPEKQGAFTGEVSPTMLADARLPLRDRRPQRAAPLFGETSAFVARKAAALLAHDIRPIVCVGETLDEREAGRTFAVVEEQLDEQPGATSPRSARPSS